VIERDGAKETLPVDTVVVCAGQEPLQDLWNGLKGQGPGHTSKDRKEQGNHVRKESGPSKIFMIGGAFEAGELDAKRAIDQGTR